MPKLAWTKKQQRSSDGNAYEAAFGQFTITIFYDQQAQPNNKPPKDFWMVYCPPLLSGVALESPESDNEMPFLEKVAAVQEEAEKTALSAVVRLLSKLQDAVTALS